MDGGYRLYWGDLHAHSAYSLCYWPGCGEGSLDQLYRYARDRAALDFCAATNHDFSMTEQQWESTQRKATAYNEAGRFVTFTAFEWTSAVYGHHNVYYLADVGDLFRCTESGDPYDPGGDTPSDLVRKLRRTGRDVLVVPHHPAVTQFRVDWDFYDPEFGRLVEITSLWGDFEYFGNPHRARISDVLPGYYAQDALARGYCLGFLGGTDSHDCRPGTPTFGGRQKPNGVEFDQNPLGVEVASHIADETANWRGISAVYAKALTREEIFAALRARRCYATTGARIQLDFRVNGHLMGERFRVQNPERCPKIEVSVKGTSRITKVEVVRNGDVIYGVRGGGAKEENIEFVDHNVAQQENYYYARVMQADGHRAWSSPVWVVWDCLPDLRVEAWPVEGGVKVNLENQGRSDAGAILLKCYRERPFSMPASDAEDVLPLGGWGTTLRREGEGSLVRLSVRWHGGGVARNFTGQMALVGWRDYQVREVGFDCAKYGGDLYTDDGAGQIRWNVISKGEEKGLDISVTPESFVRCSAYVDPVVDGNRLTSQTYSAGKAVAQVPFEVLLTNDSEGAEMGAQELVGPPAGGTLESIVPCASDVAFVALDCGLDSPIVLALPGEEIGRGRDDLGDLAEA